MIKKLLFITILMLNFVFGATYEDGKEAFDRKDYKTAFKIFEELYSKTKDFDQYELGYIYANGDFLGEGLPLNIEKALNCYYNSASMGNVLAMFNLATTYDSGIMAKQNFKEAKKFYERAAIKGHLAAQYMLGNYYEEGKGVESDIEKAVKWYKTACDNNSSGIGFDFFKTEACEKLKIYK